MENMSSTLNLENVEGVYTRNKYTKCKANPCSGLVEVEKNNMLTTSTTTDIL